MNKYNAVIKLNHDITVYANSFKEAKEKVMNHDYKMHWTNISAELQPVLMVIENAGPELFPSEDFFKNDEFA